MDFSTEEKGFKFFDDSIDILADDGEVENIVSKSRPSKDAKNKKLIKINKNTFTNFICAPLILTDFKKKVFDVQKQILSKVKDDDERKLFEINNPNLLHVTLGFLSLSDETSKAKALEVFESKSDILKKITNNKPLCLTFGGLKSFNTKKNSKSFKGKTNNSTSFIYAELIENDSLKILETICDVLLKALINEELIDTEDLKKMKLKYDDKRGIFRPIEFHMTLFRVKSDSMLGIECDLDNLLNLFKDQKIGDVEVSYIDLSTCGLFDKEGFYRPLHRVSLV
jgi:2'-5' RNA ligase